MTIRRLHLAGEDRRSLRRLALLSQFGNKQRIDSLCEQFVLAVAYENEGRLSSCIDCRSRIRERFMLNFDLDEIQAIIRRLVDQGELGESDQHRFLSERAQKKLLKAIRERRAVEATAFEQWERTVCVMFPSLGTHQIAELRDDLNDWIYRLVSDYGVEVGVLCDRTHERHALYEEESRILCAEALPDRGPVVAMAREQALLVFFERMTGDQLSYVEGLVASAYLLAIATIDPDDIDTVHGVTNGQRLYLDSNLVYSLVGLNGVETCRKVKRILGFSRKLGYEVSVSPWTVTEMEKSVRSARWRLMPSGFAPRDIAGLAPTCETDEKFIDTYRRKERDKGGSIKAFFDEYEQIATLLADEDVSVVVQYCADIDAHPKAIDAEILRLERVPGGREKERPLKEHDAKLKLLVDRHRGKGVQHLSSMKAMVLTNDHTVIQFAEQESGRTGGLPFAMSIYEWARSLKRLVPRTDHFDRSLVQMHEAPELQAYVIVGPDAILEAAEGVRAGEMLTPADLVRSAVDAPPDSDGHSETSPGNSARQTREAAVVGSLTQRVLELEAELARVRSRAAAEQHRTERDERAIGKELSITRRELHDTRLELAKARVAPRNSQPAAPMPAGRTMDDWRALEAQVAGLTARVRRSEWAVGLGLFMGGLACAIVPWATGLVSRGLPLAGTLTTGGAILTGAVAWLFGKRKAATLATGVGLVLGTLASILTLSGAITGGPTQPPPAAVKPPEHTRRATSRGPYRRAPTRPGRVGGAGGRRSVVPERHSRAGG